MLIIWQKHKATQWWEEYSFCCIVCVCVLKHNSLQPFKITFKITLAYNVMAVYELCVPKE